MWRVRIVREFSLFSPIYSLVCLVRHGRISDRIIIDVHKHLMPPLTAIPDTSPNALPPRDSPQQTFWGYIYRYQRGNSILHLTTPHHATPAPAPATIANAGGTFHHFTPEYVMPTTTTHHGSPPRLLALFPCLSQPISQRRYTAVKTRPTAVEFTPRRAEMTEGFVRRARQRAWKPRERVRPGRKIPR